MAKRSKKPLAVASAFHDVEANPVIRPITGRILIVCEGIKTEPNYFKSFNKITNGVYVYEVECIGTATNTIQVVDKAISLRDIQARKGIPYDSVWAVFDKDSFSNKDFNAAILKGESNGIGCAWSNEAFELWYIYHFEHRCTPMSRKDYQQNVTRHISSSTKGFKYQKNLPGMRDILLRNGGDETMAIRHAEQQAAAFSDSRYATHNPCTMVYKLVRQLRGEDEAFNRHLKQDTEI